MSLAILLLGQALAPVVASAQVADSSVLARKPLISLEDATEERNRLLPWLDANRSQLGPPEVQQFREHLYGLISVFASVQFQATGRSFPARDTLGLAKLFDHGSRIGLVGSGLVARALVASSAPLADPVLPSGPLALTFAAPDYTLRSSRGWSVRFPFYFMIGSAQTAMPSNGVETDVVVLSTLHARHTGMPGSSQATIMIQVAQPENAQAFHDFWLQMLGVGAQDRTSESLLPDAITFRHFNPAEGMNKEVVTMVRGKTAVLVGYFGLPGTFEANRKDFLQLLKSLHVSGYQHSSPR